MDDRDRDDETRRGNAIPGEEEFGFDSSPGPEDSPEGDVILVGN